MKAYYSKSYKKRFLLAIKTLRIFIEKYFINSKENNFFLDYVYLYIKYQYFSI